MELLIPILIILYVITSVVSAVMKSGQREGSDTPRPGTRSRQFHRAEPGERTPTRQAPRQSSPSGQQQEGSQRGRDRDVVVESPSPGGGATVIADSDQAEDDSQFTDERESFESSDIEREREFGEYEQPEQREGAAAVPDELQEDLAEDDDMGIMRPGTVTRRRGLQRHPALGTVNRQKLVEGVIWSEILKEPRAKRPWPGR